MQLINDHFQNYKRYQIPKAQLVIADIPYNVGTKAYGSNPAWYEDGDRRNGESDKAHSSFFDTDGDFRVMEFMHFCNRLIKKEPKGTAKQLKEQRREPGCMIVFCAFEQLHYLIEKAAQYGFPNYIPLVFRKNYSAQVLKANMRVVGNVEYGLLLYRDRLPKFRNMGADGKRHMVFNCFDWVRDTTTPNAGGAGDALNPWRRLESAFAGQGATAE